MPRRGPVAVLAVLAVLALVGCQTGERPYFSDDPFAAGTLTGDPAVDAVLTKLDAVTTGPATATYSVVRSYDPQEFAASVALLDGSRAVTLGNARYLQTPSFSQTCRVDGSAPCVDGLDPQVASDTTLTIDFYAADTATRLRRDAQAKVAPATSRTATFAGQTATCVDVPLPAGTATYCALDNGLVAVRNDGAVLVSLTGFEPTVDPAVFTPGR